MPTIRQQRAFKEFRKAVQKGENLSMGEIMRRAGYSKQMSLSPKQLTEKKGWQELIAQLDDAKLLKRVNSIALKGSERNALGAAEMIFKLKSRFPKEKIDLELSRKRDEITKPE